MPVYTVHTSSCQSDDFSGCETDCGNSKVRIKGSTTSEIHDILYEVNIKLWGCTVLWEQGGKNGTFAEINARKKKVWI